MSPLLVPLDGSKFAEQALPLAVTLARHLDAELNLALVRPSLPLDPESSPGGEYLERVGRGLDAELGRRVVRSVLVDELGALSKELPASDVLASLLAGHATTIGASLIVMTTHARGGVRRAWLGSVADSLIRQAATPVITTRPQEDEAAALLRGERGIRHVVVPLDGSEAAEQVIPVALRVAAPFRARFTLLRVVSPLTWDATPEMYGAAPHPEGLALSRQAAAAALERTAERLRKSGTFVAVETVMASSPGAGILDYAREHAVDLIAVTSSGEGRVRRLLLGSTADSVIRGAAVPVLVCNAARLESGHDG